MASTEEVDRATVLGYAGRIPWDKYVGLVGLFFRMLSLMVHKVFVRVCVCLLVLRSHPSLFLPPPAPLYLQRAW